MPEIIARRAGTLWAQIKAPRTRGFIGFVFVALAIIAGWQFYPSLWSPYVHIPGSVVSIQLPCIPSALYVETIYPYLSARNARLLVRPTDVTQRPISFPFDEPLQDCSASTHIA